MNKYLAASSYELHTYPLFLIHFTINSTGGNRFRYSPQTTNSTVCRVRAHVRLQNMHAYLILWFYHNVLLSYIVQK